MFTSVFLLSSSKDVVDNDDDGDDDDDERHRRVVLWPIISVDDQSTISVAAGTSLVDVPPFFALTSQ